MPEYIELSRLKDNLYREGCPVIVEKAGLFTNETRTVVFAVLRIRSISDKVIDSVLFDLHIFDRTNKEIEVIRDFQYDPKAERNDVFGYEREIKIIGTQGASFSLAIRRVLFEDESVWEGSASLLYEALSPVEPLENELTEENLLEQYRRDFRNKLSKKPDAEVNFIPAEYKDLWVCACGNINHKDEEICFNCKTALSHQRDYLLNKALIADNLKEHLRLEAERAEKARLEAERKAAAEKAAKEEAERLAELERQRLIKEAKRKRAIRNTIIAITIPLVIAFLIYLFVLVTYIMPKNKYDSAHKLLTQGDYDGAVTLFTEVKTFQDSEDMILLAKYQKGVKLMKEHKYTAAISVYTEIKDYKDSELKITQCNYAIAHAYFSQGDFERCAELFLSLGDYYDAPERASHAYLGIATEYAKNGDYDKAVSYEDKMTMGDVQSLYDIFYEKGALLYGEGKTLEAEKCFSYIKSEQAKSKVDEIYYQAALSFIEREKFDEAVKIFSTIEDYKDVQEQLTRIEYLKATKLFDEGEYEKAQDLFLTIADYEDSADMVTECGYQIALETYKAKDYQHAIELFSKQLDYKDSKDYYYKASYNYGTQLYDEGKTLDSFNVLYAIKDYMPAYLDLCSKSHYYRDLYDRGVVDNPLYEQ